MFWQSTQKLTYSLTFPTKIISICVVQHFCRNGVKLVPLGPESETLAVTHLLGGPQLHTVGCATKNWHFPNYLTMHKCLVNYFISARKYTIPKSPARECIDIMIPVLREGRKYPGRVVSSQAESVFFEKRNIIWDSRKYYSPKNQDVFTLPQFNLRKH